MKAKRTATTQYLNLKSLPDHEKSCEFRTVICDLPGCNEMMQVGVGRGWVGGWVWVMLCNLSYDNIYTHTHTHTHTHIHTHTHTYTHHTHPPSLPSPGKQVTHACEDMFCHTKIFTHTHTHTHTHVYTHTHTHHSLHQASKLPMHVKTCKPVQMDCMVKGCSARPTRAAYKAHFDEVNHMYLIAAEVCVYICCFVYIYICCCMLLCVCVCVCVLLSHD